MKTKSIVIHFVNIDFISAVNIAPEDIYCDICAINNARKINNDIAGKNAYLFILPNINNNTVTATNCAIITGDVMSIKNILHPSFFCNIYYSNLF